MARSHYSYEKRQLELKKKKKREQKLLKKQNKDSTTVDDASEYLALLHDEPLDEDEGKHSIDDEEET